MKHKNLIRITFLLLNFIIVSGCVSTPSTMHGFFMKHEDWLYFSTYREGIKIYDTKKNKWSGFLKLPGILTDKLYSHYTIINSIHNSGKTILQAKNAAGKNCIYEINRRGEIKWLKDMPKQLVLTGADSDHYYFLKTKEPSFTRTNADETIQRSTDYFSALRYDKQLNNYSEYHFKNKPNVIVLKVIEDNNQKCFWYLCIENTSKQTYQLARYWPKGKHLIAKKSKIDGNIEEVSISENIRHINYMVVDDASIWIYAAYARNKHVGDYCIVKLSKTSKQQDVIKTDSQLIPFVNEHSIDSSNLLWAVAGVRDRTGRSLKSLCFYDKESFIKTDITKQRSDNVVWYSTYKVWDYSFIQPAFYSDDEYLWCLASERNVSELPTPYILRISKRDQSSKYIPIRYSFWNSIKFTLKDTMLRIASFFVGS